MREEERKTAHWLRVEFLQERTGAGSGEEKEIEPIPVAPFSWIPSHALEDN